MNQNKTRKISLSFALSLALVLSAGYARGAAQYWDSSSSGNWEDVKWSPNAGGGGDVIWTEGSDANFNQPSAGFGNYALTVANPHTIGAFTLTPASTQVVLSGNTLTFTATGEGMNISSGSQLVISNNLAGLSGAYINYSTGLGTLVLAGTNTFAGDPTGVGNNGGVKITGAGTVVVANDSACGNPASSFIYFRTTGATLKSYGNDAHTIANNVRFFGSSQTFHIGGSGQLTFTGTINLQKETGGAVSLGGPSYIYFDNSADTIFAGNIADQTGGLLKQGGGRVRITHSPNTYTGWTDVHAGTLSIGASPNALGPTGNNRATLVMDAGSATGCWIQTYGGPQTVNSGLPHLFYFGNGGFNNADTLTFGLPGATATYFDWGNGPSSSTGLYNTADVVVNDVIISANGLGSTTSTGTTTAGGIHISGWGRMVFNNGASTYTGDTYVDSGVLKLANTTGTQVCGNGGTTRLGNFGVLTGTGSMTTPIILSSGGVMAPGDYPVLATGTLTSGAVSWPSGGHYFCAINDTNSTACTLISCGLLTITATPSAPFLIDLSVLTTTNSLGLGTNFNPNSAYSWTIVSASGGISGFDPTAFLIRSSVYPEAFSVALDAFNPNNIVLNYTPPAQTKLVTTLYNTGVDANGYLLTNGAVDAHWTLTSSPDGTWTGPNAYHSTSIPAVGWIGSDTTPYCQTIGPNRNLAGNVAPGNYVYHTTFDLTGFDPSSVVISGRLITDDNLVGFSVNGVDTGLRCLYNTWTNFTIASGLVDGTNTVDVTVQNGGTGNNPAGFQLQWSATGAPNGPPVITQQPQDQIVDPTTATFAVWATGAHPLTYQWYRDGAPVAGCTDSAYTLTPVQASDGGSICAVVVRNPFGSVCSSNAMLIVNGPCQVVQGPQDQTVAPGNPATFSVKVTGTPQVPYPPYYSYYWYRNGNSSDNVGADPAFTVVNPQPGDNGTSFNVYVFGGQGQAPPGYSDGVLHVVSPGTAPSLTGPTPASVVTNVGANVRFTASATGNPAPAYQWFFNGNPVWFATGPSLALTGVGTNCSGTYSVVVTNGVGTPRTNSSALFVGQSPVVVLLPQNVVTNAGTNVVFKVAATGIPAPTYQWNYNSSPLAGETSTSLLLRNVQPPTNGTYSVLVSNLLGSTNVSATLTVNVLERPYITNSLAGNILTLTWPAWASGWTLQDATSVTGTYHDLTGAANPFTTNLLGAPVQLYFRLRQ